jgi:hypothetical protein
LPAYTLRGESGGGRGYVAFVSAAALALYGDVESPRFAYLVVVSIATNTLFLALPWALRDGAVRCRRYFSWLYASAFFINGVWLLWDHLILLVGFSAWWLSFAIVAVGLFLDVRKRHASLTEHGVAV